MAKPKNKRWKRKGMKTPKFEELFMPFPVFSNFKVRVIISDDLRSSALYIHDRDYLKEPFVGSGAEAFTCSSPEGGYSIIYLKPNPEMGTVAHEAYHAVCAILKMIGAEEEHEVVAYHLGYIVDAIVAFNLKIAPRFKERS
jgi:hypothetical protein